MSKSNCRHFQSLSPPDKFWSSTNSFDEIGYQSVNHLDVKNICCLILVKTNIILNNVLLRIDVFSRPHVRRTRKSRMVQRIRGAETKRNRASVSRLGFTWTVKILGGVRVVNFAHYVIIILSNRFRYTIRHNVMLLRIKVINIHIYEDTIYSFTACTRWLFCNMTNDHSREDCKEITDGPLFLGHM